MGLENRACVVLLVAAALLSTGVGCDGGNPLDAEDGTRLSYSLEECSPTSRVLTKPVGFPENALTVSGRTLSFQHTLETYCNAVGDSALTVTSTVQDTGIVVTEWFEGQAVRCTCTFPISGRIEGLSPAPTPSGSSIRYGLTECPTLTSPRPRSSTRTP